MKTIVILISGRGSNMEALVEAKIAGTQIGAVISNRPEAAGLFFARQRGIETHVVDHKSYAGREQFDRALMRTVDQYAPDLLLLAGFMRVLTPEFVRHYSNRIMNIHPSLLPAFPGLHTHRAALKAGVRIHGATVHFVTAELDHGPIIIQAAVPVLPEDTEDSLANRVLLQEHRIYPQAVQWFICGQLRVSGDERVALDPARYNENVLVSPSLSTIL